MAFSQTGVTPLNVVQYPTNTVNTNTFSIGNKANRSLYFKTNDLYRFKIDSLGNARLASSASGFGNSIGLTIKNTASDGFSYMNMASTTSSISAGLYCFNTTGGVGTFYDHNTVFFAGGAVSMGIINEDPNGKLIFTTAGYGAANERIRVTSAGDIGLSGSSTSKSSAPNAIVHISPGTSSKPAIALTAQTAVSSPTNGNIWYVGTTGFNFQGAIKTSSTLALGGSSNTVTTGNSGTLSVLTDNYFTITASFATQALSASTTYYWSTSGAGIRSTVNQVPVSIPYNCTLVGAAINAWNAGSTTSQTNSTLNFRVNNTTDNVISSTILWNTGSCANCGINTNVTGLSVSLTAGDTWENKLVLGALATPPNNGNVTVTYYFARR